MTARELADESLELHRRHGSPSGEAQALALVAELEWRAGRPEQALELIARSVALAHESGFSWREANSVGMLAEWSLELGRVDEAKAAVVRQLELRLAMGDRHLIVHSLAVAAAVAARTDRRMLGARLWGAIEAEEARRPSPLSDEERTTFEAIVLGDASREVEDARRAGRALTVDEAAELGLGVADA